VKEGFRGRAIGRRLCEAPNPGAGARGRGGARNFADTRADAHRFYLRDGYRLVKTSLVFEKKRRVGTLFDSYKQFRFDNSKNKPGLE